MKFDFLKRAWETVETVHRGKAVEALQGELMEMENMFCLLSMSSLLGFPMPMFYHSLEYLQDMEQEWQRFFLKAQRADDMLATIAAMSEL